MDLADLAPVEDATITYGLIASDFELQAIIVAGDASVADDVLPPGVELTADTTLTLLKVRVGTAPTGSGLTVEFNLDGSSIGTVTVADGETEGETDISEAATAEQILTFDVTAVGSSTAGSDIAIRVRGQ